MRDLERGWPTNSYIKNYHQRFVYEAITYDYESIYKKNNYFTEKKGKPKRTRPAQKPGEAEKKDEDQLRKEKRKSDALKAPGKQKTIILFTN